MTIELRLIQEYGLTYLQARLDENHRWWYLIKITNEGKFFRESGIGEELGLKLDDIGRIVVDN